MKFTSAIFIALCIGSMFLMSVQAQDDSGHFAGQDSPEMSQEYIEQQRTKIWSCYFLTKHKVHALNNDIKPLFKSAESRAQDLYKKIISEIFEKCIVNVQQDDGNKILQGVGTGSFNPAEYDYLHQFHLQAYEDVQNVDLSLTEEQDLFYNYFEQMDKQMRERYEKEGSGDSGPGPTDSGYYDDDYTGSSMKRERDIQIGGISVKSLSTSTKLLYTFLVLGAIGAIFYLAYTKLFTSDETPVEKAKRERDERKKKREKSQ